METVTSEGYAAVTISEDIGDIGVEIRHELDPDTYSVSVINRLNGYELERLEYYDRQSAYDQYNMLRRLLGKVAAIHPLI